MTIKNTAAHAAEDFRAAIDLPAPHSRLVANAVTSALPSDQLALAASGDPDAISCIGRAIAIHEGYLIEASIAEAARNHSNHLILTGLKLPILQEALNLVNRHQPDQVRELSVDADGKPVENYFPDLVIVNRAERTGIVVDIKRSLAGYSGGGKLNELRTRISAAALALPMSSGAITKELLSTAWDALSSMHPVQMTMSLAACGVSVDSTVYLAARVLATLPRQRSRHSVRR